MKYFLTTGGNIFESLDDSLDFPENVELDSIDYIQLQKEIPTKKVINKLIKRIIITSF